MNTTALHHLATRAIEHEKSMPELWIEESFGELWGTTKSGEHKGEMQEIAQFQHDAVQDAILEQQKREPLLAAALLKLLPFVDHKAQCNLYIGDDEATDKCDCGLDEALSTLPESAPEDRDAG